MLDHEEDGGEHSLIREGEGWKRGARGGGGGGGGGGKVAARVPLMCGKKAVECTHAGEPLQYRRKKGKSVLAPRRKGGKEKKSAQNAAVLLSLEKGRGRI